MKRMLGILCWGIMLAGCVAILPEEDNSSNDSPDPVVEPPPPSAFDFSFVGTGYEENEGAVMAMALLRSSNSEVVAREATTVEASAFIFDFKDILKPLETYHLDYMADQNDNGRCDAPPADHVWRLTVDPVEDHVSIANSHDPSYTDVCTSFPLRDFSFSGQGYDVHNGQLLSIALTRVLDGKVVVREKAQVTDGAVSINAGGSVMTGQAYVLDIFADLNANGVCNDSPTDHAWRVEVPLVDSAVNITRNHDDAFSSLSCGNFQPGKLTFSGSGYGYHAGKVLSMALLRQPDGLVVHRDAALVDSNGDFSFTKTSILQPGLNYQIAFYADQVNFGTCDTPGGSADHAWQVVMENVAGDVTQSEIHNTNFVDVCAKFAAYDFTLSGSGYPMHDTQQIRAKLYRVLDGIVVADQSTSPVSVSSGAFSVAFGKVLQPGLEYRVDFYADVDSSTTCTTGDHGWRLSISKADEDLLLATTHGAKDSTICNSF